MNIGVSLFACLFIQGYKNFYFFACCLSSSEQSRFGASITNHFYVDYDSDHFNEGDDDRYSDDDDGAWERNEYGNGPNMYWDGESDEWCPLP